MTWYVCPSVTPTVLLPSPSPSSSRSATVCRMPPGSVGSMVRAKSVLRVLAGGSGRCASCAASTAPVPASATSHDSADTFGTSGAPARGRTCVPDRYSGGGCNAVGFGAPGSTPVRATAGLGTRASAPTTQRAEQEPTMRDENLIVIPDTVGTETANAGMPGPGGGIEHPDAASNA